MDQKNGMYYKRFPTCKYVFNITSNEKLIGSECPFGAKGAIDAKATVDNVDDICETCMNYKERTINIHSIEYINKEGYKKNRMKEMIENARLMKGMNNHSYLINDILIDEKDRNHFELLCTEKISSYKKQENKREGKIVKFTDIF